MIALESIGLKILIWLWHVTEIFNKRYLSHVFLTDLESSCKDCLAIKGCLDNACIYLFLSCGGGFVGDGQIWQWQLQEAWIWLGGIGVV